MAKTGLGRGLGALMGEKKSTPKSATPAAEETGKQPTSIMPDGEVQRLERVAINAIQPCASQPRKDFDRNALEELAVSITSNGIIQPLVVRPVDGGKYELIAGERRWRAAQIAGLDTVLVIVREATDAVALEMALVENLQREDLNPIEEALGYSLLIDAFQMTQESTAQRVGKSRAAVANSLRLLKLPEEVQAQMRQGQLGVGHAKVILGLGEAKHQTLAAERVIKKNLSVRETEDLISSLQKDESPKEKKKDGKNTVREVHVTSLENRLKETLGTKVSLTYRDGKGSLNIRYYSDDDLEHILKLLGVELQ